jgi:hypothetical protein
MKYKLGNIGDAPVFVRRSDGNIIEIPSGAVSTMDLDDRELSAIRQWSPTIEVMAVLRGSTTG